MNNRMNGGPRFGPSAKARNRHIVVADAVKVKDGFFLCNVGAIHDQNFMSGNKIMLAVACQTGYLLPKRFQHSQVKYVKFCLADLFMDPSVPTSVKDQHVAEMCDALDGAVERAFGIALYSFQDFGWSAFCMAAYLVFRLMWPASKTWRFLRGRRATLHLDPAVLHQLQLLHERVSARNAPMGAYHEAEALLLNNTLSNIKPEWLQPSSDGTANRASTNRRLIWSSPLCDESDACISPSTASTTPIEDDSARRPIVGILKPSARQQPTTEPLALRHSSMDAQQHPAAQQHGATSECSTDVEGCFRGATANHLTQPHAVSQLAATVQPISASERPQQPSEAWGVGMSMADVADDSPRNQSTPQYDGGRDPRVIAAPSTTPSAARPPRGGMSSATRRKPIQHGRSPLQQSLGTNPTLTRNRPPSPAANGAATQVLANRPASPSVPANRPASTSVLSNRPASPSVLSNRPASPSVLSNRPASPANRLYSALPKRPLSPVIDLKRLTATAVANGSDHVRASSAPPISPHCKPKATAVDGGDGDDLDEITLDDLQPSVGHVDVRSDIQQQQHALHRCSTEEHVRTGPTMTPSREVREAQARDSMHSLNVSAGGPSQGHTKLLKYRWNALKTKADVHHLDQPTAARAANLSIHQARLFEVRYDKRGAPKGTHQPALRPNSASFEPHTMLNASGRFTSSLHASHPQSGWDGPEAYGYVGGVRSSMQPSGVRYSGTRSASPAAGGHSTWSKQNLRGSKLAKQR